MFSNPKLQFASDNIAGICSTALNAMIEANNSFDMAYGDDDWTQKACNQFRELFEIDCEVFFVFNGTAANSLALASLATSYKSVLTHKYSHIETHECGAPEFMSNGAKILLIEGELAKIDVQHLEKIITKRQDFHYPKAGIISLTQATEFCTVYNVDELLAIKEIKEKYKLKVQMDGARFANAIDNLKLSPKQITWEVGIDVLCFSGTKNGLSHGEAIIFFDKQLAQEFQYRVKQAGQLSSKMKFISAPWYQMLKTGDWLKNAQHSNKMAQYLASEIEKNNIASIAYPVQANGVFVNLNEQIAKKATDKGWHFHYFPEANAYRLMCSWATDKTNIDSLIADFLS